MLRSDAPLPQVGVIGLGYIGLPTAAVLANAGVDVLGVDINASAVETINDGRIHIEEPGLESAVREAVKSGRLRAATSPQPRDIWLIAVPTPCLDDKSPDVSIVLAAARSIAPHLRKADLVILESTSPVGTTQRVRDEIAQLRPELFDTADGPFFAYCPERVLPGKTIEELVQNDRCIGGLNPQSGTLAKRFYELFVRGECIATQARTAEMVKLVENASRDVGIAFANELSIVAEQLNVDVWEVISLANRHPRVSILQPGPGVGGHCIAVDPWFLIASAPESARLMRTAREVNDSKPALIIERAEAMLASSPESRLACLGLSFKPDIDDLRESPSLAIATRLAERHGDRICCVEPHIEQLPAALARHGAQLLSWADAVDGCDLALLLVDHTVFRAHGARSPFPTSIDTRGMWRLPSGT